ncbi:UDP-3-O-(3-hydroxymyristoyl) glucosamine N-acyltransferase [Salipiger aestuarii]|uniref:UDP-3-O-acyl-N-acetylglucosamine deacetylase n=1 Tax=Salipiger aestuarii TaxID=568098 RepID=A0A327YR19_9RHOB|nr:UDP-3-O-acyl-N-acetylglucosamine deacetylase [Salipiger aestuarii]KAA8609778.1 UDP-3-O-(3-hydroxymyristoyl) glucosamine N-acyltransferase [Salipiger aestuarii]KAA8613020.1 UDP-3-O-(3-hydroxymyristoyl) glucosamine N-acyltransferase [Salipiger aestuarii]KAB2543807.1 UDP-3-O-(3-hydroxymyristoyl) glucosamine N-acyltransferase [Salipiger aestuarii]RAK22971.1 UDP-3-O-[3-hydroxymyristoyl] N-acetylglucosamine deacetylase [Salipiger aestuarii]
MQTTIRSAVSFQGVGLHSGRAARLTIRPASAEHGIWFKRTDILLGDALVPARWDAVEVSPLCTRIRNRAGATISTIEHVMAALAGCGIHNALVEIDGPEVPILDGSSAPFVRAILARGTRTLRAPVRAIEILAPVHVQTARGWARLSPARPGQGLTMDFHIAFDDAAIGEQDKSLNLANGSFVRELCDSRTFCRQADVDAMQANGLALGGTYENAVVVDGDKVLSPGGLRHADEAVRHKMLDALGDLYTAGMPILGHYEGHKAGHAMTNMLLAALFAAPDAWRVVECDAVCAATLPGAGVEIDEIPAVA